MNYKILSLKEALNEKKSDTEARRHWFRNTVDISAESHKIDDDGNVEVNFQSEQVKQILKNRLKILREHNLKNTTV